MPQKASGSKRERQYEHIKESYQQRGQKGRAKEIAARTVNKERAEAGETKGGRSSKRSESPSARSGKRSGSSSKPSANSGSRSSSRASAGRSNTSSSRGSSSRASASSGGRTRQQLYDEAKRKGISGRSSMNKAQLERALSR